jgi:hypothetical protein
MTAVQVVWDFIAGYSWMIAAGFCTVGYVIILSIMIRKIMRDNALSDDNKPPPRPLFYLGQAYLAFVWPVPLFLVLEFLDVLTQAQ